MTDADRLILYFAASVAAVLAAQHFLPEKMEWKGWVYPDRNYLSASIPLGNFASLEKCRRSAQRAIEVTNDFAYPNGNTRHGDYECGFKCTLESSPGSLNVCEKTER